MLVCDGRMLEVERRPSALPDAAEATVVPAGTEAPVMTMPATSAPAMPVVVSAVLATPPVPNEPVKVKLVSCAPLVM